MDRNVAYANALATAFASDLTSPEVARMVQSGGLTQHQFSRIVDRDVARGISNAPGPALFPAVRAFARQTVDIATLRRVQASGLASLGEAGIMDLGGAIIGAVSAIWGAKMTADANSTLAKIALQRQQIAANAQAMAAKSALIQNATAQGLRANADGQLIDPSTGGFPTSTMQTVGIAAGILAVLAAGGYYMMHR